MTDMERESAHVATRFAIQVFFFFSSKVAHPLATENIECADSDIPKIKQIIILVTEKQLSLLMLSHISGSSIELHNLPPIILLRHGEERS